MIRPNGIIVAGSFVVFAEDKVLNTLKIDDNILLKHTKNLTRYDFKSDIIRHLWKIIISDKSVDQYESNLMRRICGLIYFPDKECAEIKLQLLDKK